MTEKKKLAGSCCAFFLLEYEKEKKMIKKKYLKIKKERKTEYHNKYHIELYRTNTHLSMYDVKI